MFPGLLGCSHQSTLPRGQSHRHRCPGWDYQISLFIWDSRSARWVNHQGFLATSKSSTGTQGLTGAMKIMCNLERISHGGDGGGRHTVDSEASVSCPTGLYSSSRENHNQQWVELELKWSTLTLPNLYQIWDITSGNLITWAGLRGLNDSPRLELTKGRQNLCWCWNTELGCNYLKVSFGLFGHADFVILKLVLSLASTKWPWHMGQNSQGLFTHAW